MKKLCTACLAVLLIFALTGCNISSKDYNELKAALDNVKGLSGGRISLSASYTKSDMNTTDSVTDFLFMLNEDDSYAYVQTQFDADQKALYCEYSDGSSVSQWLIGNGWSDSTASPATKSAPHRFITLLSTVPEKDAIKSLSKDDENGSLVFSVTYKPEHLNDTLYKDTQTELLSQTDTYTLNQNGDLVSFVSSSEIKDNSLDVTCKYTLSAVLSEQNAVTSITKPELRDNFFKKSE